MVTVTEPQPAEDNDQRVATDDAVGTDAAVDVADDAPNRSSGVDDALLAVDGLRKEFGGITALDGTTVGVGRGITGLIGPNGAGKTTLFNCITGFLEPDGGQVRFAGEDITGARPAALAQQGLVRTFQIPRELESMTVRENLLLATPDQFGERLTGTWRRGERFADDERRARRRAEETAEFFELDHLLDEPAGNLSGGQRKLLELARALLTDPDMLLLDEPMAGVNPSLQRKILDRIHDLEEQGYAFLLVEHDIDVIMEHCERVIVLHRGEQLTAGTPEEVRTDERVIEAYLGGEEG
ncbi:ABC transporter ATP-binding protein [Halolamina sp.]|uniref:ABC transporter ATP-binding protein n=1 Tax=Halolamina sp. TaxID=1940283 RepID=UPI000223BFA4|nr:Sulfate-transporting ATPase [halophilic archaeon DL31]